MLVKNASGTTLVTNAGSNGKFLAVLVIKPVKRSTRNPHGLIVIEYRQSPFEKKSEG